jgi:hypothetical protein
MLAHPFVADRRDRPLRAATLRAMNRRSAPLAAAIALLAAAAIAQSAATGAVPAGHARRAEAQAQTQTPPPDARATATLKTELPCYLRNQTVRISGSGFSPGAAYTVTVDRAVLGPGTVGADGTIAGSLSSGKLPYGVHERRHRLQVSDGANLGRSGFSTSAFDAVFAPSAGDPRTLRVSFAVYGLGLGRSAADVFVHYLDPRGHLLATVALGRTSGPCGSMLHLPARPLFPFSHVMAGRWRLQFDTSHSYATTNQPRIVREVAVGG